MRGPGTQQPPRLLPQLPPDVGLPFEVRQFQHQHDDEDDDKDDDDEDVFNDYDDDDDVDDDGDYDDDDNEDVDDVDDDDDCDDDDAGTGSSRSLVQETSGCKSMLTSLTSSLALIAVILSLAPLFQHLPVCVLAAIILASLAGMFKKMTDVKKFWARSPYDGALWLVTFLATVLVDVDIGLGVGVSLSILLIMLRSSVPSVTVMDREDILRESTERENFKLDEEANLKIIQVV